MCARHTRGRIRLLAVLVVLGGLWSGAVMWVWTQTALLLSASAPAGLSLAVARSAMWRMIGTGTWGDPPVPEYAAELVRGVTVHSAQIDELLAEYAEGWTLERMPAVDRNVLRIGVFELLWAPGVPDGVAISEAVLLVQDLSTDGSAAFVNGLLAKIAQLKPSIPV